MNSTMALALTPYSFMDGLSDQALVSGQARHRLLDRVRTVQPAAELVPGDFTLAYEERQQLRQESWWSGPRGSVLITTSAGWAHLKILTMDADTAASVLAEIGAAAKNPEEGQKFARLWRGGGQHGPVKNRQCLDVESWLEVARNYPARVRTDLTMLMNSGPPKNTGRLLLWHGEPGTGKTRACLALIDAWYPWSVPHVITDPERLFSDPDYLTSVMDFEVSNTQQVEDPRQELPQWNLIICEDADEYLRADARASGGPALGRLLNATDGILGRMSRCLILLTTNDPLERLHPAVTRPGRCLSNLPFPRFTQKEAAEWLGTGVVPDSATLAELYAIRDGRTVDLQEPLTTGAYL